MIRYIFIAVRISKNITTIPQISVFLIIFLILSFIISAFFSGGIQGAYLYMERPELRYRYELFVNLWVLQFQTCQVILVNHWFTDGIVGQCVTSSAHIADGRTACPHLRGHDRFQPLDISLQLFGILF